MLRSRTMELIIVFCFLQKMVSMTSYSLEEFCKSFLTDDYKSFESPLKNKPVKVCTRLDIMDIGEINDGKMDYLLQIFLTTLWKDTRIKLNDPLEDKGVLHLPAECLQYIWKPNAFFETAKRIDIFKSTAPSITLNIYMDGNVSFEKRYLFQSSCNMHFRNYPFDTQRCEFFISLDLPDAQTFLSWANEEGCPFNDMPVVSVLRSVEPLQYQLGEIETHKIVDVLPHANYTTLVVQFVFYRRIIGSIINTFIPSTLIVFMSFVGFWFTIEAVPARVALSVTSLLTLCTQIQQYQSQLPPANYIKAMDIWLFVCISFVFSTLIEFAISFSLHRKRMQNQATDEKQGNLENKEIKASRFPKNNFRREYVLRRVRRTPATTYSFYFECRKKMCSTFLELWKKLSNQTVDQFSQKLYPGLFITFAIVYWTYYIRIYFDHM